MMKKVYRYFGGFTASQETWLNEMAAGGFRLVKTGKLLYEFEPCEAGKYQYKVEFIADKSQKDAESYKAFLEGCGYTVFYKNINLNYSVGKMEFRPWASEGGKFATNSTTYNKELLIIEKENDGKEFILHTTAEDRISFYRKWRNVWLTYVAMFALMGVLFAFQAPTAAIILGVIGAVALVPVVIYQVQIRKLEREAEVEE